MIYMVEMGFSAHGLREKWDEWYLSHMKMLITIPGIRATQRFEALHDHVQPYVAMHEVTGPDVFTSDAYKAKAGPASTGEWRTLHTNWVRNVFDGIENTPDVGMNAFLILAEAGAEGALPADVVGHTLRAVGLDRNPAHRMLAVSDQPSVAVRLMDHKGIRVLKPLTPRLVAGQV
jgi:hypothetical protein